MRDRHGSRADIAARVARGVARILLAAIAWPVAADAEPDGSANVLGNDAVMPHIEAVLTDPAVGDAIDAWGLSVADVRHDIASLTPVERVKLAYVLTRRWRATDSHDQADLQAQFLVMLSLMRESTLFASILSSNPYRLR